MLNKAERFKILKVIGVYCTAGGFPAVVDLSSWQLHQHSATGRKKWLSLAYFGTFVLHSLYKVGTLLGLCFTQTSTPSLHLLIIHALLAICTPVVIFWYYQLFIKHPGAFGVFLQMTLTGNIGGTVIQGKEGTNSVKRVKAYSLQDITAISLPYMITAADVIIIGTCMFYPNLHFLLYAGLPEQYQNWLSFTVLLAEEVRFLLILSAVAVPVWTLQIISFDLVNDHLQSLIGSIGRAANRHQLQRIYNSLRHIQLYIGITNVVNRHIIFSWKVFCIAICIGTGVAGIAHFSDYPFFGVMYYLLLIDSVIIYTVSYGKAFKIPRLFKEATEKTILRLSHACRRDVQAVLKRQMRSIPRVGIQVGDFHMFERQSTPIFVHYVLSNIVSMLVAYRH